MEAVSIVQLIRFAQPGSERTQVRLLAHTPAGLALHRSLILRDSRGVPRVKNAGRDGRHARVADGEGRAEVDGVAEHAQPSVAQPDRRFLTRVRVVSAQLAKHD